MSPNNIQINFSHPIDKNLGVHKNNFRLNEEVISIFHWASNATQIVLKVKTMERNTVYQLSIANLTSQKHKNFPTKTVTDTIISLQVKMSKPIITKIGIETKKHHLNTVFSANGLNNRQRTKQIIIYKVSPY